MIHAAIIGGKETVTMLEGAPSKVRVGIKSAVTRLTLQLLKTVKQDKLSGQVLNVRTGRLRRSINSDVLDDGISIIGSVGTNVEYAKYHEFGDAQTDGGARGVLQALKKAAMPASVNGLPPRSFLRSALFQARDNIHAEIEKSVHEAFKDLRK